MAAQLQYTATDWCTEPLQDMASIRIPHLIGSLCSVLRPVWSGRCLSKAWLRTWQIVNRACGSVCLTWEQLILSLAAHKVTDGRVGKQEETRTVEHMRPLKNRWTTMEAHVNNLEFHAHALCVLHLQSKMSAGASLMRTKVCSNETVFLTQICFTTMHLETTPVDDWSLGRAWGL